MSKIKGNDAMSRREFILTDGNRFIKQDADGKYKQTTNLGLADIYSTQLTADNIRLNSIPKSLSRKYRVAEIIDGEIVQIQHFASSQKIRTGDIVHFNNSYCDNEWCNSFECLEGIFDKAYKRGNELIQELRELELKIVDVEHYIEFNNLNAREGYKIYKKLNELLCKRRDLKFEQKVVNAINKNHNISDGVNEIISTIKDCKRDVYKPRILADLFKEGDSDVGK